jgi:hypothetical protein
MTKYMTWDQEKKIYRYAVRKINGNIQEVNRQKMSWYQAVPSVKFPGLQTPSIEIHVRHRISEETKSNMKGPVLVMHQAT